MIKIYTLQTNFLLVKEEMKSSISCCTNESFTCLNIVCLSLACFKVSASIRLSADKQRRGLSSKFSIFSWEVSTKQSIILGDFYQIDKKKRKLWCVLVFPFFSVGRGRVYGKLCFFFRFTEKVRKRTKQVRITYASNS